MEVVAVIYFSNGNLMAEYTAVISGWVLNLEIMKEILDLQQLPHLRMVGK